MTAAIDNRRRPAQLLLLAGVVLVLATVLLGWGDRTALLRGWLAAVMVWIALPLGALAVALAHGLTGGRWGAAIARETDAAIATLPMALLALPILFDLAALYPWAGPAGAALPNHAYLNPPFFILRSAGFFILWFLLAAATLSSHASGAAERLSRFAGPGLLLLVISATFFAIDWMMSLEPRWSSSVYGLLSLSGILVFSLAFLIAAAVLAGPAPPEVLADLAKLLLGAVIFWAYLGFIQFLIIWESDLSTEIPWYLRRSRGGWGGAEVVLVLGHFVLPFALLIQRRCQRNPRWLGTIAVLLLVMHAVNLWWLALPATGDGGLGWVSVALLAGVSCLWLGTFLWLRLRWDSLAVRLRRGREMAGSHG